MGTGIKYGGWYGYPVQWKEIFCFMSQWFFFEAKAPPHLQRMRYVISNLIGLKHLLVLFVIANFLTLGLVNNASRVTAEVLFQSPQSPPAQPEPPVQQAPPTQPPAVEQPPAAEQPPAQQPPAEQPPAEQPSTESPAAVEQQPVDQPAQPEQPATSSAPAEQPAAESVNPDAGAESAAPTEPDSSDSAVTEETRPERVRPARDTTVEDSADQETSNSPRNFILDRAEFVDTIIVSGAYVWLCCGVALFLVVPLVMLVLYIRGRSKIVAEDEF
jgi:type IV secretory pathway VirB10-like protein